MAKKRRKKRKLKFKNIFILLAIIILIAGVLFYALEMPIKNIYIKGNNILDDNTIINESGLSSYPSFLLTSSNTIIKKLEKNDYISKVKINKKLGNVIEIEVNEYKPLAIINDNNQLLLSNGKIVDNIYNITDLPIVTNDISSDIYDEFVKKFSNINSNILRQISEINYTPTDVDKSRFLLYMDDGNYVYITLTKIKILNKYNKIKDKMGDSKGKIYLDSGNYVELFN